MTNFYIYNVWVFGIEKLFVELFRNKYHFNFMDRKFWKPEKDNPLKHGSRLVIMQARPN